MRPVYGEPPALYGEPPVTGEDEAGEPVYGEPPVTGYGPRPVIGSELNPDCAIPAEAVEITAEQRDEFLSHPGTRRWDGSAVVSYTPPPPAVTINDVIAERARRLTLGFRL
jgi:hypothetical protein